ncbi:MAG TPA: hypothetical protein VK528_08300 [Flavobacterium sp.]|nr:hypothetical protein [Flavobacterium sp.]
MRFLFALAFFTFSSFSFAQKPCDFSVNVVDSIGQYRVTKDYLVYEKNFAGNSSYIFYSIAVSDGTPTLNVQFIEKSFDFIKAKCFDKNSKMYLQLENGKIVTLIHIDKESCGSMVRDDKTMNNRLLTGYFMFKKDDFEYLKNSPISLIRIKYSSDTVDYILRKDLTAELDGQAYEPANYFVNYFHCIEDNK